VLSTQLCFSKLSCASRLKASAATVLSRCGAVMPQVQWEQHQLICVRLEIRALPYRNLARHEG
jgi:hypothetical protein